MLHVLKLPLCFFIDFFVYLDCSAEDRNTEPVKIQMDKHASIQLSRTILTSPQYPSTPSSLSSARPSAQRSVLFTPVLASHSAFDYKRKAQQQQMPVEPKSPLVKTAKMSAKQPSDVMVPIISHQQPPPFTPPSLMTTSYKFSPPHVIATHDATQQQKQQQQQGDGALEHSPIVPYVFSPPLLRSATKQKKAAELSRTATAKIEANSK